MWTVLFFLNLGALHCTVSRSLPSPINVTFSSVNLRNELQWFPGSGTPADTHFKVEYAIYGDSVEGSKGRKENWRAVRRCTEIMRSWCDLSNETWDQEEGYHARVCAVSRRRVSAWALTRWRFDPKTDTSFGPPLVSVEIEDNNAIFTLKGPMRYQSDNRSPAISMATLYPQMTYNLSIENRGTTLHVPVVSNSYTYRLMEYNTEYCFSAKTRFQSMPAKCLSLARHCITTPQDPLIGQLQSVVVGIVIPSVCMCMLAVLGYFLYRYLTGKGQKSPYILDPPAFHPPVLMLPPDNPNIIVITIIKEIGVKPDPGPPGYASQRPEEPWDDLLVDYGFVGVTPETATGGDGGNNPKGEDQERAAGHRYEKKECGRSAGQKRAEMNTPTQARAWLLAQTQASSLATTREEDGEFPGLFISTTPQTGLFRMPLNLPTTQGAIDGGAENRGENEELPLLSAYARRHDTDTPPSHSDPSDFSPDDRVALRPAHRIDEGDYEEEGNICIDWNPETGRLVLPQADVLMLGEKGGKKEEEVELRLENVFVRQGSEEMAEAQREMEGGGGTGWEADDLLTRWNLVISMDQ
ncbi:interleukin-20 receptor subunit alpha [Cyclopterus lumpus]|uniref:Uncharacterized protein n=1 Tax=Cyclopterus lumpus TaxID=8103 RepID=A0A8C3AVB9_CYCLU|nr:interleukin-20 receptor subunit alpha [Cyclopterus lumpus]